jgi:hypothetical protein
MRALLVLVGGCLIGCAGDRPDVERCNVVRSWSNHPLGNDFLIADPVPLWLSEDGLTRLLSLAPATARRYGGFCGAVHSDGLLVLTPNIPEPVDAFEAFEFRQESGQWTFVGIRKIYGFR